MTTSKKEPLMLMRRHLVTLGLGASLFLAAGCAVGTRDAYIGSVLGADVALPVPKGYCALNKALPADKETMAVFEKVNAGRNSVLMMFADCKQLEARRTKGEDLANYGNYLAPASRREPVTMPRPRYVAEIAKIFKQEKAVMAQAFEEAKGRVKAHNPGVALGRPVYLGLLHSDDTAAYMGVITDVQIEGGGTTKVATVTAMTLVRNRVISVNLAAPVDGKDPVPALLDAQRGIVRALIAAND